jgi:hypothetical protein
LELYRKGNEMTPIVGKVKSYFEALRFSPRHHLGLGDIRLTIGQQEEILSIIEGKDYCFLCHEKVEVDKIYFFTGLCGKCRETEQQKDYKEMEVINGVNCERG